MKFASDMRLVVVMALSAACLTGCGLASKSHGVTSASSSWQVATDDPLGGVDQGTISTTKLICGPPDGVTVAIWSDLPNGTTENSSADNQLAYEDGEHRGANGRRLRYRIETRDGEFAVVRIEGSRYDSEDGRIFLVTTRTASPRIRQLDLDPANIPTEAKEIKAFAEQHEEISTFFLAANDPPTEDDSIDDDPTSDVLLDEMHEAMNDD